MLQLRGGVEKHCRTHTQGILGTPHSYYETSGRRHVTRRKARCYTHGAASLGADAAGFHQINSHASAGDHTGHCLRVQVTHHGLDAMVCAEAEAAAVSFVLSTCCASLICCVPLGCCPHHGVPRQGAAPQTSNSGPCQVVALSVVRMHDLLHVMLCLTRR